jgi:transmembrane sensor
LLKYSSKVSSTTEEGELFELLNNTTETEIEPLLTNILENTEPSYDYTRRERILASVLQYTKEEESGERLVVSMKPRVQLWKRIAVAASIIGAIAFAGYWMMNKQTTDDPSTIAQDQKTKDVTAPDKNRAQIKLANGAIVYLDSAANGQLALQNDVKLVKTADDAIAYDGASTSLSMTYNTLTNPRGSKVINMTLADGSRVWLNAGSSVTYPIVFIGKERNVTITGEAYFEIAHDKTKPFKVSKGETTVEVLGTHFNVNAYDDESEIKVTLLEGKVKTSMVNGQWSMLNPGEQAHVGNSIKVVSGVDVEQVMAWKNGRFEFKSTDIETIMREVARWYDVEIVYNEQVNQRFNGKIPRTMSAMNVFKVLKETGGVHFKIEGRKVIVSR